MARRGTPCSGLAHCYLLHQGHIHFLLHEKKSTFCAEEVYHSDETQQQKGVEAFYLNIFFTTPASKTNNVSGRMHEVMVSSSKKENVTLTDKIF